MHTRSIVTALLLIGELAIPARAEEAAPPAERPPNIIYVLADDLGYGELGCYGQKWIRTPHIDRIAAEGIRFTQHYSGSPVCAPARGMLMTGLHPGHAYVRDNGNPPERGKPRPREGHFPGQHPIPDGTVTIAELLRGRGYATAAVGKWGLGYEGSSGDPNAQGFDLFYGYLCQIHAHNHYPRFLWRNGEREVLEGNDRTLTGAVYAQDRITEEALDFIRAHRAQPFFLYFASAIPHLSIQAPDESLAWYADEIPEEDYTHRGYLKHPKPRAGYAAMVTHFDRDVGKIMALVEELGLDERTIILFASDNGPTYRRLGGSDSVFFDSAGGLRGYKGAVLEGGLRVPLVARWPGRIAPGQVTDHVSAFWDVLPTFCELAGIEAPEPCDGISFAPTLLGADVQPAHEYLYWEFPGYGGQQAVRMGRWKALRQKMGKGNRRLSLYDLDADRGEAHDVADEHPEIVARIEAIMRDEHVPSTLYPHPVDKDGTSSADVAPDE
jgi:arylsulfatase